MFWQLFKKSLLPKLVSTSGIRLCSSSHSFGPKQVDFNNVKLLGTIMSAARTLPNGVKSVVVRTHEDRDAYSNHLVNMRTEEPLAIGERIYIFGVLSSKSFSLDDGRLRQKFIIKSKYIRVRGHDRSVEAKDENHVEILAKITSDIRHTDKYSLFTLASTHRTKGEGQIPGLIMTEFYKVIVYDQSAFNVDRNTLKKHDRVQVEGKISYMPYKNADGKTVHGGLIVADNINHSN